MLGPKTKTIKFSTISIYSISLKTTTTQFIFIMQGFDHFYHASYSIVKHQHKIKIPPNLQSCYIKDKISNKDFQSNSNKIKKKKKKLPLFFLSFLVSHVDLNLISGVLLFVQSSFSSQNCFIFSFSLDFLI